MQPQRETLTDSLADIIQIIYLGNKDGTLTIERGESSIREEGFITFLYGRCVEARVGAFRGPTAFNYLKTWRRCRFSFAHDTNTPYEFPAPTIAKRDDPAHVHQDPLLPPYREDAGMPSPFPVRSHVGEVTVQYPETMTLSRIHHRLLLLINGQRSPDVLARLIRRDAEETQALLDHLEEMGLIQQ